MIIFSSKKLEHALANDSLSGWNKVKYIILPVLIMSLFSPPYIVSPIYGEHPPMLNGLIGFICLIFNLIITYRGIKKCFETNQQTDAKLFFERFFILSVPVLMKFLVIIVPLTIVPSVVAYYLKDSFPVFYKRLPIVFSILIPLTSWIYYHLISRSIERVGKECALSKRKKS